MKMLFRKWCELDLKVSETWNWGICFNNKIIFEGKFNTPEIFKLVFDDKELVSIENLRPQELDI